MPDEVIRVVIADDHAVVRSGLRLLLEAQEDLHVVAEAGDVPTAMQVIRAHRPSVAVLDLNMPGGSGLEAIPKLRESTPETAIVVLTIQDDPAFAAKPFRKAPSASSSKRRQTRSCWRPSSSPRAATPI